jgi:hypothetical protein
MAEPERTPTPDAPDAPDAPETPDAPESGDLGDLDERSRGLVERANREAAERRRELRAAQAERDQARRELAEMRQASESESERLVREAEDRGRSAAAETYERRLAEADVVAVAAGRMRDPRDAVAYLDLSELVDVSDLEDRRRIIGDQLDRLLESKPYLALDDSNGTRGPLVSSGGRSEPPASGAQTPDAWIRKHSRRRG